MLRKTHVPMATKDYEADKIRQDIVKNHLMLKAVIQDILQCTGPLELLNELNADGREKIAALKSFINDLAVLADTEIVERKKTELLSEVASFKEELNTCLAAFRKANIISACVIDKTAREDLLTMSEEQQTVLRKKRDKQNIAKASSQLSDKLLSISRHLAEVNQRSADTLDTLITSSDKVYSTKDELDHQQQVIVQSGKLLGKYGRREVTDKALLALAFAFFLACVLYILQKRLF